MPERVLNKVFNSLAVLQKVISLLLDVAPTPSRLYKDACVDETMKLPMSRKRSQG